MRAHSGHLKYMLVAGTVILVGLAVSGVSLAKALPYALLLACPLSMVAMMAVMSRSGHGESTSCHDPAHHHEPTPVQDQRPSVPAQPAAPPRLP